MGFWSNLLRPRETMPAQSDFHAAEDASELVEVVGESHYQGALRDICGSEPDEDIAFDCVAVLVPEPNNPYDAAAVMVQIEGQLVGYLSRSDARAYRASIDASARQGSFLAASARIAGRGPERGSRTTNVGVFLKLPPPS